MNESDGQNVLEIQLLSTAQFAYNNTQNETTEETPF